MGTNVYYGGYCYDSGGAGDRNQHNLTENIIIVVVSIKITLLSPHESAWTIMFHESVSVILCNRL